jgi:hypothetical protein
MPPPPEGYSWKSLESAPPDEDVTLQVTDGHGKPYILVNASRLTAAGWVSSINVPGGHAGEVEAIRRPAVSPRMTSRRFPPPWRADKIADGYGRRSGLALPAP